MISPYIVDCNIMPDDCPFDCCIFWETCIYQFSHAQENIRIVRGSLLTKDKTYIFLYRADALEPAEALLLRLLPAAWLNTLCTPGARQKGRFVTLACKKLSFCLAYEVKPRNRPHISSLSTECGTGALEARRVRMWGRRVKSGTASSAMHRKIYELFTLYTKLCFIMSIIVFSIFILDCAHNPLYNALVSTSDFLANR